jgi:isopentenyl-diphosphate delta-isomerase
MDTELVVFVNEDGTPTGQTGPKLASHTASTQLHLGFSCYIFRRSDNAFLLSQRAKSKKVWPGVWTNSVCGHPAPNESVPDAIRRRAAYELGLQKLDDITCVLPTYRYTTPPYNGIIENEFCPVYIAYTDAEPQPNPDEVEAFRWVTWPEYAQLITSDRTDLSYWATDQYTQLRQLELFRSLT